MGGVHVHACANCFDTECVSDKQTLSSWPTLSRPDFLYFLSKSIKEKSRFTRVKSTASVNYTYIQLYLLTQLLHRKLNFIVNNNTITPKFYQCRCSNCFL